MLFEPIMEYPENAAGQKRSFSEFTAQHETEPLKEEPYDCELISFLDELNFDGCFFYDQDGLDTNQEPEISDGLPIGVGNGHRLESRRSSGLSIQSDTTTFSCDSYTNEKPTFNNTNILAHKNPTAMEVFLSFIRVHHNENGEQVFDVSQVITRPCFEAWLASRKKMPNKPEECFRKSLLAHISCSDGGSASFNPLIEKALLKMLRKPGRVWPCFAGRKDKNGKTLLLGIKGLRAIGFHERQRIGKSGLEVVTKKKQKLF